MHLQNIVGKVLTKNKHNIKMEIFERIMKIKIKSENLDLCIDNTTTNRNYQHKFLQASERNM